MNPTRVATTPSSFAKCASGFQYHPRPNTAVSSFGDTTPARTTRHARGLAARRTRLGDGVPRGTARLANPRHVILAMARMISMAETPETISGKKTNQPTHPLPPTSRTSFGGAGRRTTETWFQQISRAPTFPVAFVINPFPAGSLHTTALSS